MVRSGLAIQAVLRRDTALAAEQYAALEPHRGMAPAAAAANDRVLGLLAQTMGNLDQAVVHFEESLAFCRKGGYGPELAWTCHDFAETLLQRNGSGDRAKAMALLGESLAVSNDLGMSPLAERVTAIQAQAGSVPAKAPQFPAGLSRREVEVLQLVASGKTNPEVAEELFITLNTVARHLTNIFTKTGTANRAEASVYAARQDLL